MCSFGPERHRRTGRVQRSPRWSGLEKGEAEGAGFFSPEKVRLRGSNSSLLLLLLKGCITKGQEAKVSLCNGNFN